MTLECPSTPSEFSGQANTEGVSMCASQSFSEEARCGYKKTALTIIFAPAFLPSCAQATQVQERHGQRPISNLPPINWGYRFGTLKAHSRSHLHPPTHAVVSGPCGGCLRQFFLDCCPDARDTGGRYASSTSCTSISALGPLGNKSCKGVAHRHFSRTASIDGNGSNGDELESAVALR